MSHCRFENTANDLRDCWDNFDEINENSTDYEKRGRKSIIKLACHIAESYADEIGKHVEISVIE